MAVSTAREDSPRRGAAPAKAEEAQQK